MDVEPTVRRHEIGMLTQKFILHFNVMTMLTNLPVPYDLCVVPQFQPGEGPRRGLLRDCKTLHDLRQPSFQAQLSSVQLQCGNGGV